MYLAEIGKKINSKTICWIKNLFVTTYVRAYITTCVRYSAAPPSHPHRLPYVFSLSLCTRTEASRKSSYIYIYIIRRVTAVAGRQRRKTSGRNRCGRVKHNNSLFFFFSISPRLPPPPFARPGNKCVVFFVAFIFPNH